MVAGGGRRLAADRASKAVVCRRRHMRRLCKLPCPRYIAAALRCAPVPSEQRTAMQGVAMCTSVPVLHSLAKPGMHTESRGAVSLG